MFTASFESKIQEDCAGNGGTEAEWGGMSHMVMADDWLAMALCWSKRLALDL